MKLIQLQILVGLKKYGSFSKTAQNMYTSQPAISVLIKAMEDELGNKILERGNRGVTFTPYGELVLSQAEIAVQAVNQIYNISYQEDNRLHGSMTIASLPHLCNSLLLDIQIDLSVLYPDFRLNLENRDSNDIIECVAQDKINMGLIQLCDIDETEFETELQRKELEFLPLFQDQVFFVGGAHHPLVQRDEVEPEELLQYPYLSYAPHINRYADRLFRQYDYQQEIITINEFVRMRKYAAKSTAISFLPALAIQHGNLNYQDKFFPIHVRGLDWTTWVGVIRRKKPMTETERLIIQQLKKSCQDLVSHLN